MSEGGTSGRENGPADGTVTSRLPASHAGAMALTGAAPDAAATAASSAPAETAPVHEAPGPNDAHDPEIRREVRRALIWVGLVAGVWLAWQLWQPLLLILGGFVAATIFDGGVRLLGRVLPIGRGWRVAIILLAATAALIWVGYFAGSQIAQQWSQLQAVVVTQANRAIEFAAGYGLVTGNVNASTVLEYLGASVGRVTAAVGSVASGLTSLFMIFVLGIFIVMEPRLYERGFGWFVPIEKRTDFYDMSRAMGSTLRRLMAGRLLGMVVEGVATGILLAVYGIPLAALIGLLTGLLVFIPNIGAILSGALMVLVGFSVSTDAGLYAFAVYLIVQTIDGYVIVPMVAKRTVDLAPALVLGAQLIFGTLFGILGLALADPIVALLKVALTKGAEHRHRDAPSTDIATQPALGSRAPSIRARWLAMRGRAS